MDVADISFMTEVCRDPAAAGYPALAFKFDSERLPVLRQTFRAMMMLIYRGRYSGICASIVIFRATSMKKPWSLS
jgi:hypothetical protein